MEDENGKETTVQRHKREQKELQAKIQGLKHSIPKGDKKRKKQVTIEVAQLEAELDQKQQQELEEEKSKERTSNADNVEELCDKTEENLKIDDTPEQPRTTTEQTTPNQKKPSKAQKRREKKEQEERERQQRLAEGVKESANHVRNLEAAHFDRLLKEHNLEILEVQPDGNCLYNSIIAQQPGSSLNEALQELRQRTAEYMRTHQDDFLPFTSDPATGDMLNEEQYTKYCDDIEQTNTWGGHLEIRAISHLYGQRIEVYQATAPKLLVGEEFEGKEPIRLSYHRHQYGLGEHYNALVFRLRPPPSTQ